MPDTNPLALEITVSMGGSTGTWTYTDPARIVEIGDKLIELIGEPDTIVEAPDARSAASMALELARGL